MHIERTKRGIKANKITKIIIGFLFVCLIATLYGFWNYNKPDLAVAEGYRNDLNNSFDIYSELTEKNFNFIKDLQFEYENLELISAANANEISNIGNNINNHIKVLKAKKISIGNSDNEDIKSLHIKMLNNLLLQELYLNNSVKTVRYFNCMVEKKANFNLIWEGFNETYTKDNNPTIENITSPESINYFKQYSITAKKSVESIDSFTTCFEDKFYVYKDSVYDEEVQKSQTTLEYMSFTYNKFADLLTGTDNEVELIATIEEIETFNLSDIIFFSREFDQQFIIKPAREIFKENVKTDIEETFSSIELEYNNILNSI